MVTQINLCDKFKLILPTLYTLRRMPYNDLVIFLTSWLVQYSNLDYFWLEGEISLSAVQVYNFNFAQGDRLKEYLRKYLNLKLKNYLIERTALRDRCIDSTFSRYTHSFLQSLGRFHVSTFSSIRKITSSAFGPCYVRR